MNRKVTYEDCIKYIEKVLRIKLFDYQKEIIKCFCEGKEVRVCRAGGRSICAEAFGKYIAHLYDSNNYSVEPDIVIPYQKIVKNGLLTDEHVKNAKLILSPEAFEKEYCSPFNIV